MIIPVTLKTLMLQIDEETCHLSEAELHALNAKGEIPNGICNWLIALRKADIAIPTKEPRPRKRKIEPLRMETDNKEEHY